MTTLPALVQKAAQQLASAKDAATILAAKEDARAIYDKAKRAARFAKAQKAHGEVVAAAHKAQADALEIETAADRRLADEYDAAQERGEIVGPNGGGTVSSRNAATAADVGLSRKQVMQARQLRDAETADPGVIRRTLDQQLDEGKEPTRTALREAVVHVAMQGLKAKTNGQSNRNPLYVPPTETAKAWTHLYGTCRALREWATAEKVALARAGLAERTDSQTANIGAVKSAASLLLDFLKETGNVE